MQFLKNVSNNALSWLNASFKYGCISFSILLFGAIQHSYAQKEGKIQLKVQFSSNSEQKVNLKDAYPDSLALRTDLNAAITGLHAKSYLLAGVDSFHFDKKARLFEAWLYIGESYKWANVKQGNVSTNLARKADFKERWFLDKPFRPKQFFEMEKALITYSVNHGFPFASVKLDSVSIENATVSGILNYEKGTPVVFDSIIIRGGSKINRTFLQNYLQIKPRTPFDQRRLDQIKSLIAQLKAVKQKEPYRIRFKNEQAQVMLILEDLKTSSIDGIAGFQQNPKDNSLLFTGQFDLGLNNIGGRGKSFEMHWKKTDVASQLLNLTYEHLSLFGTGFHAKTRFELFKQDTSFVQRKPYLEFFRNHPTLGKIKFFYQLDDSRTIGIQIIPEGRVPTLSSVRTNYYGLGIEWNNLDRVNFARSGWKVDMNGSAGNKTILNSTLTSDQNLDPKSLQIKLNGKIEKHLKLNQFFGVYTNARGGWVENPNLFLNELYRLGGIKSMRGFRENSFYANQYAIGTLEGRFFLDDQSYLLVFSEYAVYENNIAGDRPPHNGPPLGLGAGITFSTRTGVFSFIYAVGREGNGAFNFANSVINFGLTSRF